MAAGTAPRRRRLLVTARTRLRDRPPSSPLASCCRTSLRDGQPPSVSARCLCHYCRRPPFVFTITATIAIIRHHPICPRTTGCRSASADCPLTRTSTITSTLDRPHVAVECRRCTWPFARSRHDHRHHRRHPPSLALPSHHRLPQCLRRPPSYPNLHDSLDTRLTSVRTTAGLPSNLRDDRAANTTKSIKSCRCYLPSHNRLPPCLHRPPGVVSVRQPPSARRRPPFSAQARNSERERPNAIKAERASRPIAGHPAPFHQGRRDIRGHFIKAEGALVASIR